MKILLQNEKPDIMGDILNPLENWCRIFNRFAVAFFLYMKFLFSFILISIGILTLFKLRGIYKIERTKLAKTEGEDGNMLKRPRLVLGSLYIMMGIGILFNFFTSFLSTKKINSLLNIYTLNRYKFD